MSDNGIGIDRMYQVRAAPPRAAACECRFHVREVTWPSRLKVFGGALPR